MQNHRGLDPRRYQGLLQNRLQEAASKAVRVKAMVKWQEALIATMSAEGRDVALAREVLATLFESLDWNQQLAVQAQRDLDFVNRNLN